MMMAANKPSKKDVSEIVGALCNGLVTTKTKAGWCLKQGLTHVATVDGSGRMLALMQQHGIPSFYSNATLGCRHAATQDIKDPTTCFQSLCRVVAGQFVSGQSAQAAYQRLVAAGKGNLTPRAILSLEGGLEAGLTKAKTQTILELAERFDNGTLSEEFLESATEPEIRAALLQVRGIGPWSCDIFLQFNLERPNILPLGDLGVRKGISIVFLNGKPFCHKKDGESIRARLQMYEPFQSLLTYYMWRAADTPAVEKSKKNSAVVTKKPAATSTKEKAMKRLSPSAAPVSTPTKRRCRPTRKVTP